MLTIDPTSICDVCGDQYGTVCLPYLIPCGHTFCRNCLVNINDNNPKGASCPLCRDTFTLEQIHLVRVDPADPLPKFSYEQINHSDDTDSDLSDNRTRRGGGTGTASPWNQEPRIREEARQLELRVQQAASVKCTFEEVSALRDDIQNWLLTEPKYKPISKFLALRLSAALLRAILLNSLAFSEASKTSKIAEDGLRDKIKALESQQTTLQADIRRQQQQYSEKSHECTQLRQEVERLRRANPGSATTSRLHSSPFPGPASPTSPTSSTASSNISSVSASSVSSSSSMMQSPPPPTRYLSSPETTSPSRLPPPRSVTTSPTRMNPYAPTSLSSIMSGGAGGATSASASSRSSSAASSASSSPSTQPVREFFTPQSSRQTSPAPAPTSPPTPIPYATRPHHSQHHHQPKSGLESLMARTSAQPAVPRSMTAPLPPNGATPPPPIRNGTRPRPIQTSTANANARNHAYPKVWLPMIDDTEDANSAAENTYTYSHMSRQATLRGPGTPTQTSIRR